MSQNWKLDWTQHWPGVGLNELGSWWVTALKARFGRHARTFQLYFQCELHFPQQGWATMLAHSNCTFNVSYIFHSKAGLPCLHITVLLFSAAWSCEEFHCKFMGSFTRVKMSGLRLGWGWVCAWPFHDRSDPCPGSSAELSVAHIPLSVTCSLGHRAVGLEVQQTWHIWRDSGVRLLTGVWFQSQM